MIPLNSLSQGDLVNVVINNGKLKQMLVDFHCHVFREDYDERVGRLPEYAGFKEFINKAIEFSRSHYLSVDMSELIDDYEGSEPEGDAFTYYRRFAILMKHQLDHDVNTFIYEMKHNTVGVDYIGQLLQKYKFQAFANIYYEGGYLYTVKMLD